MAITACKTQPATWRNALIIRHPEIFQAASSHSSQTDAMCPDTTEWSRMFRPPPSYEVPRIRNTYIVSSVCMRNAWRCVKQGSCPDSFENILKILYNTICNLIIVNTNKDSEADNNKQPEKFPKFDTADHLMAEFRNYDLEGKLYRFVRTDGDLKGQEVQVLHLDTNLAGSWPEILKIIEWMKGQGFAVEERVPSSVFQREWTQAYGGGPIRARPVPNTDILGLSGRNRQ